MLRYLSRYTHRVAISNRRLIAADMSGVTSKYKDYRLDGRLASSSNSLRKPANAVTPRNTEITRCSDQPCSRPFDFRIEVAFGEIRKSMKTFAAAGCFALVGMAVVNAVKSWI